MCSGRVRVMCRKGTGLCSNRCEKAERKVQEWKDQT